MMTQSNTEARANIQRAIQVIDELSTKTDSASALRQYLDLMHALHRELSAIDNADLALSTEQYRAITFRFSAAKAALEQARADAEEIADSLGTAAQFIQSLTKLAGSL